MKKVPFQFKLDFTQMVCINPLRIIYFCNIYLTIKYKKEEINLKIK